MMIREIYYGDFRPSENMIMSEEYQKKSQTTYKIIRKFEEKVSSNNKEEFGRLLDSYMDLLVAGLEEGYTLGFKDGIKLIIEVQNEK